MTQDAPAIGDPPAIAVLGASGLIGGAIATGLAAKGFAVAAIARRFTAAQSHALSQAAVEAPVVSLDAASLSQLLAETRADILINCIGVLQDGPRGRAEDVHVAFTRRLLAAIAQSARPILFIQVSIPGHAEEDLTGFSRSKRQAEQAILSAQSPFIILRPGFVIAPAAYGGSALIRALAAFPVAMPEAEGSQPFAATAVSDIVATLAHAAMRWRAGERDWRACWDVMERRPGSVNDMIAAFRRHFGGPAPWLKAPSQLLGLGARCADLAGSLGWSPPIRSTALAEMRRGVSGDPEPWIAATGIEPKSLAQALEAVPAVIQERWFARLYLAKALVLGSLALFWIASGLVALTAGFDPAVAALTAHGFAAWPARLFVSTTSLLDLLVGALIAIRASCRRGLVAGLAVSAAYVFGASALAPELWADPLGPLVKILPSVVLTLVALAIVDDR